MKKILLISFAANACSFSPSPLNGAKSRHSFQTENHMQSTDTHTEKKISTTSALEKVNLKSSNYRNYLKCFETEFNFKSCRLNFATVVDSKKDKLSFDYLVKYRFACPRTSQTEKLSFYLQQQSLRKNLSLTSNTWKKLAVFSSESDVLIKDQNIPYTDSIIIPKTSVCELNIKAKKVLSKTMIENTRVKISWIRDLYSFYKPLIKSRTPLTVLQKKDLKSTVFKMEETLEHVIKDVKTAFLYDHNRSFSAEDRNVIYQISNKIK